MAVQNRMTFTKGILGTHLQVNTVRMVTGVSLYPHNTQVKHTVRIKLKTRTR